MNLYEAIFIRRSVKKFRNEQISSDLLDMILDHYRELPGLFGGIRTDAVILNGSDKVQRQTGFTWVRAPYYLAFYSEEAARYQMNMGYLIQQMALYLCTLGLDSCLLDVSTFRSGLRRNGNGLKLAGILAFGKSREPETGKREEVRRLSLNELCVFKEVPRQWMMQLLDAARMAPSVRNAQPWRVVVYDSRIHIFTKKHQVERFARYHLEEQSFGGMLANILVAAEELWVDVDMIRLENISQKNFPNNQYVLSAIMRS